MHHLIIEFAGGVTGSTFTGSFTGDGVGITGIVSASHTLRADIADQVTFASITGKPTLVSGSSQVTLGSAVKHHVFVTGSLADNIIPTTGSNSNSTPFSSILGGTGNIISGSSSRNLIGGGTNNSITGSSSNCCSAAIVGGAYNSIHGSISFIGSGNYNSIGRSQAGPSSGMAIAGGDCNIIDGNITSNSFIGSGLRNIISGSSAQSMIGSGQHNHLRGASWSVIAGGRYNCIRRCKAFIGSGECNYISNSGDCSVITGGAFNTGSAGCTFIGGGYNNSAAGSRSVVTGGSGNTATGVLSTVSGGGGNTAGLTAVVAGGDSNSSTGQSSFVGGGLSNNNVGGFASIAGGRSNTINSGKSYTGILGGCSNTVNHDCSFIIGTNTTTTAENTTYVNNLFVTGSTSADNIVQLALRSTSPTPAQGMIINSGSAGASVLYFYNGSVWKPLHS